MDVESFRVQCGSAGTSGATEAGYFSIRAPKTLVVDNRPPVQTTSSGYGLEGLKMLEQRYLGQRISFDGHLCTVRYVGPVKNTKKGDWLGVEWDDPSRGKHDGSYEGERYFQCRYES